MKTTLNAPPAPTPPGDALAAEELLDALPWGVLVLDEQRVIWRVNQQAARWCSAPAGVLLGRPLATADLLPAVRVALLQLLENDIPAPREVFLPAQERWLAFSAARQSGGWVLYGQDVTPHKQREQQYQALAENTPDVLTRWTPDLRLRYANAAFATEMGQPLEAMLGRSFAEMGAPTDIAGPYMAALQRVFATGRPQEHFNLFPGPHGSNFFYSRLVPELHDGRVETVLGIARDITELKQTQAEAMRLGNELTQRATDRYQSLFHAMDQGFCVLEILFDATGQRAEDFRYMECNPAFARQSGMPADVLGKTARQVVPDLEPFWFETYGRVALTGQTVRVEHYVPPVGRWLDVHAFRVGPPEVRQVAVLFNDITARKQAETSLRHTAQANAFRLRLVDALGPLTSPMAIEETITRLTRLYFNADRCYYCEITGEQAIIRCDAAAAGLPSAAGTYPLTDFGRLRALVEVGRPFAVYDLRQDPTLDEPLRQQAARLGVVSCLNVPLLKNGQPAGVLCLVQATPREWTAADTALATEVAERTWSAVERARTEQALTASEEKYRTLFTAVDDGFAILELLVDAQGRPADFVYLETNPAFNRDVGVEAQGKRRSEVLPENQGFLLDKYAGAVATGEALHLEYQMHSLGGQWFQTTAARIGGAASRRLGVIVRNITERKRREANLAFLADLHVEFAPALSAEHIMARVTERLADYLHLSRCHLAVVDATSELLDVVFDWRRHAEHLPSVLGKHRIDSYLTPAGRAHIDAGQPLVLNGQEPSPLIAMPPAMLADMGFGSSVDIPHLIDGRWHFLLSVARAAPGTWAPDEVELLQQLGVRIYARLERAQAEAALQESELKYRNLFDSMDEGYCIIEVLFDAEEQPNDWRYLEVNPAFEKNNGLSNATGKTIRELTPDIEPKWFATYGRVARTGQPLRFEEDSAALGRCFTLYAFPVGRAGSNQVAVLFTDITARKQAEDALRLSEERLSLALQAGRMGSFEWTSDGDRISLSAMSEEVLGLRPGMSLATSEEGATLLHPDDYARHRALFDEAGRTGNDFHSIFRIVRPSDGEVRWIEERGQGTRDAATGVVCLRGVHWDVTEAMLAQQRLADFNSKLEQRVARRTRELQASRDLLQSVFDTNLIAMSVQEAVRDETGAVQDFRLRLVSRELERETGRTDLVGKLYAQEYPGIREAGIFDLAVRALETGQPQDSEYFYPHEGFNKWFACQFVKLGDNGIVATNLDITERKNGEHERLHNLRLLEQAEAVAGLGSWDYNLATGTLRWSDGMYQLFGLPTGSAVAPADYLGRVLAEDRPRAEQLVQRLATGAGDSEETLRLRVNGQVKTVRMKSVVLRDEQGQAVRVLGVDLDISQLQRLEQDNLRLRLHQQRALFEAVQAAQEAERKRMAETLHNGIGQILYATKLHLDRLHAPLLGTDPALVAARREADQLLGEAIRQTRALSHELVPMVLAEFGLNAALQDICSKMSSPLLRFHCSVQFDQDAAPLSPALQMALYRMAQELTQNAVKHARGATEAGLELETMPGWVLMRAEDNGPGFASAPAESTGLGLRSIRDRVALLGGQLEMGTVPTGGAYVRIRLPLTVPSTP